MANADRNPPQVRAARERKVFDDQGGEYILGERLSKGGQGTIVRIKGNARQIVKLANDEADAPAKVAWARQLERIRYLPIQDMGLPVVMPLAYISKPRPGYVMELMEGLVPLESLMTEFDQAMREGRELQGFVQSGGLGRRLALLARLARVLASLHGLGIAHGDLSPNNVFVSSTHTHAQVWLIDVDNLCYAVRDSSLQIYTPDYGAPELLRGDLGVSTYTDIWSFAVIAFQLLTHLHPIKSGLLIDGDAELEADALKGVYPWIDHPDDDRNRAESGMDRALVCTPQLQRLFDQCFRQGLNEPSERPVMAEWAEAFEAAAAMQVRCDHGERCCGGTFYWNSARQCAFCGQVAPEDHQVLLRHFVVAAKDDLPDNAKPADRLIASGWQQVLNVGRGELRLAPPGSAEHARAEPILGFTLAGRQLALIPSGNVPLALRWRGARVAQSLRARHDLPRGGQTYLVHVGDRRATHDAWRFEW
jgi:DNA-binding helix-hairpin-helix protein with protein kinase domain